MRSGESLLVCYPNSSYLVVLTDSGLQILPAVVLGALIMLFPESPRWLIDHGRSEKGLAILAQLHANGNQQDPWVLAEFEQIQESITFEHEHEAKSVGSGFIRLLLWSYLANISAVRGTF